MLYVHNFKHEYKIFYSKKARKNGIDLKKYAIFVV